MWLIKFQNRHDDCILSPKCIKYQITDFVYLINAWKEKEYFNYTELHILQGTEENKKKFIKDLRKEKTIKKLEIKGDHIFTLNQEPIKKEYYSPAFDPKLIFVKPVEQRKDGYEYWEVAAWDKEPLIKILDIPNFQTKLISIKETNLGDIFLPSIHPKLSPKQKEAIELAVAKGYYEWPKKTDLNKLSKITKVKRQTFQETLRRAEKKLIPFLTENLQ